MSVEIACILTSMYRYCYLYLWRSIETVASSRKSKDEPRVVITGMGTINPLGFNTQGFWDSLIQGKSGIRRVQKYDVSDFSVQIAGEIDLPDLTPYFKSKKMIRRLDPYILYSLVSATQAIKDSGLDTVIEKAPHRYGVLIGTGYGATKANSENLVKIAIEGIASASPFFVINVIPNTAAAYVAQEWNLQGPSFCVSSACATSNHAIGLSALLVKSGLADAMLAGGTEAAVHPTGLAAFGNIMALSMRNDSPETASRPFDRDRDGFVLSEGAGILCLEELEHAKKRNAPIYGEITGFGCSSDAHDLVAPHPDADGASRAIRNALDSAGLVPDDIDLINSHATSTPLGDQIESRAVNAVFGSRAAEVPVQSTKSMVGHLLGAAGAVEAIATLLVLERGLIHPTINQFEKDPDINLNIINHLEENDKVQHILSNGFGFGGQNAAVIISRFRD